jgi:hypothetical protein
VSAIWSDESDGWQLLAPIGFADEAALHTLVERSPEVLPLSGAPRLAVVGREVLLGSNRADLIAIEPTGRPCVIEVKLAVNSEARRAVVAQVLSYAAYFHRMDPEQFEEEVLATHLHDRGALPVWLMPPSRPVRTEAFGQGNNAPGPTDELLNLLAGAYREASGR